MEKAKKSPAIKDSLMQKAFDIQNAECTAVRKALAFAVNTIHQAHALGECCENCRRLKRKTKS